MHVSILALNNLVLRMYILYCNAFVMSYVGVKCPTRHCSDTLTRGTTKEVKIDWYNVEKIMSI